VNPDDPGFLHPDDITAAIAHYCRPTRQQAPGTPPAIARAIHESQALKYLFVLERLERLTGTPIATIRVIGGGARYRLLNQFTANATGRTVIAGPTEATALGNLAIQMVGTRVVSTLAEARRIIEDSFSTERYFPANAESWEIPYSRFREYLELTCA
jgi:sugar (pentulose or hexulose) kinase